MARNSNLARTREKSQLYYSGAGHEVVRKQQNLYSALNRNKVRDYKLKSTYGASYGTYDRLLGEQNGGCAICGRPEYQTPTSTLFLDHDHVTGELRGLLCTTCNFMVGYGKESPLLLRKAADYLEKWGK